MIRHAPSILLRKDQIQQKAKGGMVRAAVEGGSASPEDDANVLAEGARCQSTAASTEKLGGKAAFISQRVEGIAFYHRWPFATKFALQTHRNFGSLAVWRNC
jgi:hypothetical protein